VSRKIESRHFGQNQIGTVCRNTVLFQYAQDTLMVLGGGRRKNPYNACLKHCLPVFQIVPICPLKIVTRELQNAIVRASKEPLRGLVFGGSRAGSTAV
jgi:hypothetical protein